MSKSELANLADMSVSYLSDLTTGKESNPSLKLLERIANAVATPLPTLLESNDLDKESLDAIAGHKFEQSLPNGYVRICAVLPESKAFIVRKWEENARKKLNAKDRS